MPMPNLELFRKEDADPRYTVAPQYVILLRGHTDDGHGNLLLTKRCESLAELDSEIVAIKAKLDEISADAHHRWPQG